MVAPHKCSADDPPPEGGSTNVPEPAADDDLNKSLDDVLLLMSDEVDRLKASLEFLRNSNHQPEAEKGALIRWHVQQIDHRQDRIEELKRLILASRGGVEH